ncbi:MAG TPA: MaoC/PaaZ C-terminal domain-containing protein [Cellulomonas sp.]
MSRELTVGATLPEGEFTVDAWRMKVFALLMADPNPVHFDPQYVASLGQGDRPVNQGTLTVALPLNTLIAWLAGDDASARIAHVRCRFTGSAHAGDTVRTGGRVAAVDPDGNATVDLWVDGADGARILTGSALVRPPS